MTQSDIDALQIVLNSPPILAALKQLFKEATDESKPEVRLGMDDSTIGQSYRGYVTSKEIINEAFKTLEGLKKPDKSDEDAVKHI